MRTCYVLLAVCLSWLLPLETSAQAPGSNNQVIINRNGAYGSALVVTDSTGSSLIAPGPIQALNIPNACVSVDSQGAMGDGTTQDGPAFRAAVNAAKANGTNAICLSKGKIYKVSDTVDTIQLPGDGGGCPAGATGCTPLAPEATNKQAYSFAIPSNFRIFGNGAEIRGGFSANGTPSLTTPMMIVCSDETSPGSIQPIRETTGDFALKYGNCANIQITDLKFGYSMNAFFAPGVLSKSLFERLNFGTMGFLSIIHVSDRSTWRDLHDDNSNAGIVIGGWWVARCCFSLTAGTTLEQGGYSDDTIINKYVHTQLGNFTTVAPGFDSYFDTYFYKSFNSTNGRALTSVPPNNYHGVFGIAYNNLARYGRSSNFGEISNLILEATARQGIYEEALHNQGRVMSVAIEGTGFCNQGAGDPVGSTNCPDPIGTGNGGIATGVLVYNAGGTMSFDSVAPAPTNNYQNSIYSPVGSFQMTAINSGGSTTTQSAPANIITLSNGNSAATDGLPKVSGRLDLIGSGIAQNGQNLTDGWSAQTFPPSVYNGDDSLSFVPIYSAQQSMHKYYVKLPGLKLCTGIPTTKNTDLTNCNSTLLNLVQGTGSALVSNVGPIFKSADNTNQTTGINVQTQGGVSVFRTDGADQVQMNNDKFLQFLNGASQLVSISRNQPWLIQTQGANDIFLGPNQITSLHLYPSGGAAVGSSPDPGNGTLATPNLKVNGSQALNGVQGTTGSKIPAAAGTFTSNHLRMTNATGDEVDSGVSGFTGSFTTTTGACNVVNGIITSCS